MVPRNARSYIPVLFALCALITLSVLVLFLSLVANVRTAVAAPVDAAQGGTLAVSTTNLTNCNQCTVNVINQSNKGQSLFWSASNHGIPGVTFNPQSGRLRANQQITVNISFPSNITCPANDTITFASNGASNSVNVYWNCSPTPTPTPSPTPITPTPTPTPSPTPSPTPVSSTPTVTPTPIGGIVQQNNGNPPTNTGNGTGSSGGSGSSALSILLSVGALLLGLFAFTLYLIPPANSSARTRLLALILPVSFLKRPPPQP